LTDKAYPLRVPGNPAAGREHGTAKEVRDYFNKCVANRGNIGEQPLEPGNHTQTPGEGGDRGDQAPQKTRSLPRRLALSREILSAQNGLRALGAVRVRKADVAPLVAHVLCASATRSAGALRHRTKYELLGADAFEEIIRLLCIAPSPSGRLGSPAHLRSLR
jgi:hypothetical protein